MAIWHVSRGASGLASASWAQAQASCCMGWNTGRTVVVQTTHLSTLGGGL